MGVQAAEKENKIELKNVSFDYVEKKSRFSALKNISLEIKEGEFICLLGSSGCGKSTLLSLLNGLNRPSGGQVLVNSREVTGPGVDRAVVFQQYSLFPWLTVKGNVIFGIRQSGKKYSKAERDELAERYVAQVGLDGAKNKYPSQLSGGMKQRVAVARALALEADILLLDEPFGAVDPRLRLELQELVSRLCTEHQKTVVFVTHDMDEAILLADRIVVMEPGRIRKILDVDIKRPRHREELIRKPKYEKLRNQLVMAFYDRVRENIDLEVVL